MHCKYVHTVKIYWKHSKFNVNYTCAESIFHIYHQIVHHKHIANWAATNTVGPRDTRPQAARTLTMHVFE